MICAIEGVFFFRQKVKSIYVYETDVRNICFPQENHKKKKTLDVFVFIVRAIYRLSVGKGIIH